MECAEIVTVDTHQGPVKITRITLPSGKNLYIGDEPDIIDLAAQGEIGTFFVLGSQTPVVSGAKATHAAYGPPVPAVFKVVRNMVGTAILEVKDNDLGLQKFKPTVYFNLPKIPWGMVQTLDAFFRKIDTDLGGSEAIVILTYDRRCNDSSGWGFVVPEQQNSAVHCNYNHESVMAIIEDADLPFIAQVGTAHSHPGMSAFASHTDTQDQANFDGIHITFGWPKSMTEFHIEQQMSGEAWTLPIDAIFEIPPLMDDPNFKTWAKRVKKDPVVEPLRPFSDPGVKGTTNDGLIYHVPRTAPDPNTAIVVAELLGLDSKNCPMCYKVFAANALDCRRCLHCLNFIARPGETVEDIIKIREEAHLPIEPLTDRGQLPVKYWHRSQGIGQDWIEIVIDKSKKALPLG